MSNELYRLIKEYHWKLNHGLIKRGSTEQFQYVRQIQSARKKLSCL